MELDNLEGEGFPLEIGRSPKADGQIDLSERGSALSQHDTMEWCCIGSRPRPTDPHEVDSLSIQDVEATTPVHQDLSESGVAGDGVDDEWIVPRVRDIIWVVVLVKCDDLLGLIEERWDGGLCRVDLSAFGLSLVHRESR
jgi:hypothetical protein